MFTATRWFRQYNPSVNSATETEWYTNHSSQRPPESCIKLSLVQAPETPKGMDYRLYINMSANDARKLAQQLNHLAECADNAPKQPSESRITHNAPVQRDVRTWASPEALHAEMEKGVISGDGKL